MLRHRHARIVHRTARTHEGAQPCTGCHRGGGECPFPPLCWVGRCRCTVLHEWPFHGDGPYDGASAASTLLRSMGCGVVQAASHTLHRGA